MLLRKNALRIALFGILLLLMLPLWSAYLTNMPVTVRQPDGTEIKCFASGDEFHHWLHDADNFTITKAPLSGYYVYAVKSGEQIAAGNVIVGSANPRSSGLTPNINISNEEYKRLRRTRYQSHALRDAPTTGTVNNLVVYIRFSDQTEYGQNNSIYDGWFNSSTVSQKNYFLEASYNQLTVNTTFYPAPVSGLVVSWQDSHPRNYYLPYDASTNPTGYNGDAEYTDRLFTLLQNATAGVASAVPAGLTIDADGDGNVDNVVYIVKGAAGDWADLLWPHRWSIYDRTVMLNGKRVYDYNFQLSDFLASSNVGVLCHEFFHTLGAPDLYHYNESVFSPVGSWDVMESTTNPPQHMGAYMKWKYGDWIPSVTTISANGTYILNPLTSSTGNCYRINSPNSSTEYFLVEYRRKTGTFENSIPGSGLLVYRINTGVGDGNADGPPDEVYIYRPGGTTSVNGTVSSANFSSEAGRTVINDTTNPSSFLTSGAAGGLSLLSIGSAGATISFINGAANPGMPACTITAPVEGTTYITGDVVTVNVTATDTSPGTISRVDFYLDGAVTPTATDSSSPYSWGWNTTGATNGSHTIIAKAVDNENNVTPASVSINVLSPAEEGFETGNLNAFAWTTSGDAPWTVQSAQKISGTYAAKSGLITTDQSSSMAISMNITTAGNITFYQKTSSELNYDFLKFYIDSVEQGSWSGEVAWTLQTYPVTTGTHEFKWTYSKDGSVDTGSDCGYVDHINFPPHGISNPPTITWSPTSITQSLAPNATASQNLIIGNTGDQTLSYTATIPSGAPTTVLDETFATTTIPTGWTQVYDTGTTAWTFATGGYNNTNPSTAYDGTYNARLYFGSSAAVVTKLVTPALDMSGASAATLTFWHTQALWPNDQDELRVYYKTTSGGTWTLLTTYTNNITAWTQETISLPALSSTYYIGFQGTAKYGYGVCLDKIVVTKQGASPSPWLSLNSGTTASGSIPDGGANQTITVGFNTTGMTNGTYNSTVTVTSNSTTNSTISIPVALTVATPTPIITVSPTSLAYGTVLINTTSTRTFTIANTGNAVLTGTITTPTGYTVSLQSAGTQRTAFTGRLSTGSLLSTGSSEQRNSLSYNVAIGATNTYNLVFAPTAVQVYNGTVTITHNAGGANKTITLTGQGGKPTIGLSSTAFTANLAPGGTNSQILSLSNSGNMALNYSLTISGTPAWLTINGGTSVSNTIAVSGAAQNVTIACNAAGMTPGVYNATINGTSNDPASLTYSITVALTVRVPITISAPSGGEIWETNSQQTISWNYSGTGNSVSLLYSVNDGVDWFNGGTLVTVNGVNSHNWLVPANPSTICKVKLVDAISPNYAAISNTFTIQNSTPPSVPVDLEISVSPVSGDMTITWNASAGSPTGYRVYQSPTPVFTLQDTVLIGTRTSGETFIVIPASNVVERAFFRVLAFRE